MPELPEVEVVRRGLVSWVRGRTITSVDVLGSAVPPAACAWAPEDFAGNLEGARVLDVVRRGKFLWMPLADSLSGDRTATTTAGRRQPAPAVALMAHLGMSGQLLMQDAGRSGRKAPEGPAAAQPGRRACRSSCGSWTSASSAACS